MVPSLLRRCLLLLPLACATAKPPPPPTAALPPLPRSSIAAVLNHRAELGLSQDQVQKLEAIDQAREKSDASLREELAAQPKRAPESNGGSESPGMGMGGRGRGGGRHGGGGGAPARSAPEAETVQERLDAHDTGAFLAAEEALTGPQKAQAEELASSYRAALFDRRQAQEAARDK